MSTKRALQTLVLILIALGTVSAQSARRPFKLDDLARFREVRDPQLSPDGQWVAYVVCAYRRQGRQEQHAYLDGQLRRQERSANHFWSRTAKARRAGVLTANTFRSLPPGREARGSQIWLLDRSGGEAYQLTELKGRLQGYEWSPDSKRLALVIGDPDPEADTNPQHPQGMRALQPRCRRAPATPSPKTTEANRHRSLSLQAGCAGISTFRAAHLPLSLRHCDQKTRSFDKQQMGRILTVMVT